jgi:hypothetical protein
MGSDRPDPALFNVITFIRGKKERIIAELIVAKFHGYYNLMYKV